jgi:hypothetical protein
MESGYVSENLYPHVRGGIRGKCRHNSAVRVQKGGSLPLDYGVCTVPAALLD